MQATQPFAQRLYVGIGRIQRKPPLVGQPVASLVPQPAAFLSPLRGQSVALTRQRFPLTGLRLSIAVVWQQGRRPAEESFQLPDVLQGAARLGAFGAYIFVAAEEAPLDLVARQQLLTSQCSLLEQQQCGAGTQVRALEPGLAFFRIEVQPVLNPPLWKLQSLPRRIE